MKKYLTLIYATLFAIASFAQAVGIGTSSPNANAILDISSGSKGLLLPRVGVTQRDAMVNPPSGLLLYMNSGDFNANKIGFYYRQSGEWRRVLSHVDIDKTWQMIPDAQYSLMPQVGIGLTDPSAPLHIRRDGAGALIKLEGGLPSIYFYNGNATDGYTTTGRIFATKNDLVIGGALGSSEKRVVFQLSGENKASFEPNGDLVTKAQITLTDDAYVDKGFMQLSGNNLRVGTFSSNSTGSFVVRTNGADRFTIFPTGNATLTGTLTQNSDERLKQNISTIDNALEKVMQLNGYEYYWKRELQRDSALQIGLLAQNVEKVLPALVSTDNEGIKSVAYQNMVPVLIEAIKLQQQQIQKLESKILALTANAKRF